MPLLEQLTKFGAPGNPNGVCTVASAVTAHVLMEGPDSLAGKSTVTLPLRRDKDSAPYEAEIKVEGISSNGGGYSDELDVRGLRGGIAGVWESEDESDLKKGKHMIEWLQSSDAKPGVYAARLDDEDEDDPHFFNIAKTENGEVYLLDSSVQNFVKLNGPSDAKMDVIAPLEEEEGVDVNVNVSEKKVGSEEVTLDDLGFEPEDVSKVGKQIQEDSPKKSEDKGVRTGNKEVKQRPLFEVYCSGNLTLDFCGSLHKDCALELQQGLRRAVRESYSPSQVKSSVSGSKHSVV